MADPLLDRGELDSAPGLAANEARRYLEGLSEDYVLRPGGEAQLQGWSDPMPEDGDGALAALTELVARGRAAATRSSGPRFFHFVMGGGTPAALGADWLTSAYDQVAYAWASSPFAARLEQVAVDWLRQLFELPEEFGGVLTTGATMANFVGLAAARNWWGERLGVDVERDGLVDLPAPLIISSGYLHPSAMQAIGILGLGRGNIRRLAMDQVGRLELAAMERELAERAEPAIVIANAGEVNAGDFDPLAEIAELAERHGAWLHVDGAFGLFTRLAPATRHLTNGVERADSVAADGHKWLNVPYECGFAFVREIDRLPRALNVGAPYLPSADDPHPNVGFISPENSRRARALAVWATLRAYGRAGYREMVERHLRLAQHLAARVDSTLELERLAEVPLNIVCFRARPPGISEERLNELNSRLGEALRADGRVFAGTTTYGGKVALRPAIVNWQTDQPDIDLLVDVVRELIAEELPTTARTVSTTWGAGRQPSAAASSCLGPPASSRPRGSALVPWSRFVGRDRKGRDCMAGVQVRDFDSPDETRASDKRRVDVVRMGDTTATRFTLEPGWKWSEYVGPVAGTQRCGLRHVGVVEAGRLRVAHDDGSDVELAVGDAYVIEPGHDAWVIGDETFQCVEFESLVT